jgi:6-phosphofructokinase 1
MASRMGAAAVEFLIQGRSDVMAGEVNEKIVAVPLVDTFTKKKGVRKDWINLEKTLSI